MSSRTMQATLQGYRACETLAVHSSYARTAKLDKSAFSDPLSDSLNVHHIVRTCKIGVVLQETKLASERVPNQPSI
jgi:hypothetical protein